jgi:hypothetical protein
LFNPVLPFGRVHAWSALAALTAADALKAVKAAAMSPGA